ncbi:MAG: DUF3127 domain-containing protein [Chitinophagales bacterium]
MSYEVSGRIVKIFDTQVFNSGFQKREFVVETQEQYPQPIKLEFFKDKCSVLDKYNEGDQVNVSFNLRGNEYNEKFFVNLQAWKMEKTGQAQGNSDFSEAPIPSASDAPPEEDQEFNDLPF